MTTWSGTLPTPTVGQPAQGSEIQTLIDAMAALTDARTAYTPAWASSGTQPAIGNGTREGRYLIAGKLGIATGRLAFGSTTTFGTGTYTISLPFSVLNNDINPGVVALVGATPVPGVGRFDAANTLRIYGPTGGQISPTVPFTWANGHQIQWTVVGEVA